jgi:hypothetical protein
VATPVNFTIAPGVRVSASGGGLRSSVGDTVSRGVPGHAGIYSSTKLGGVRVSQYRSSAVGSHSRPSLLHLQRLGTQASLDAQIEALAAIERALVTVHHEKFEVARPFPVERPVPVDRARLITHYRELATHDIGLLQRERRRAARAAATQAAIAEADRADAENLAAYETALAETAAAWARFVAHDPEMVIEALETAFMESGSEATCVDAGIIGAIAYATVVIVWGSLDLVPERTPALTPTGKKTTKPRSRRDRNQLYVDALGSAVLATVREGFAAVPSLRELRVVVLRRTPDAATEQSRLDPIFTGSFDRERYRSVAWARVKPAAALLAADDARFHRSSVSGEVSALDVDEDPALRALVETLSAVIA